MSVGGYLALPYSSGASGVGDSLAVSSYNPPGSSMVQWSGATPSNFHNLSADLGRQESSYAQQSSGSGWQGSSSNQDFSETSGQNPSVTDENVEKVFYTPAAWFRRWAEVDDNGYSKYSSEYKPNNAAAEYNDLLKEGWVPDDTPYWQSSNDISNSGDSSQSEAASSAPEPSSAPASTFTPASDTGTDAAFDPSKRMFPLNMEKWDNMKAISKKTGEIYQSIADGLTSSGYKLCDLYERNCNNRRESIAKHFKWNQDPPSNSDNSSAVSSSNVSTTNNDKSVQSTHTPNYSLVYSQFNTGNNGNIKSIENSNNNNSTTNMYDNTRDDWRESFNASLSRYHEVRKTADESHHDFISRNYKSRDDVMSNFEKKRADARAQWNKDIDNATSNEQRSEIDKAYFKGYDEDAKLRDKLINEYRAAEDKERESYFGGWDHSIKHMFDIPKSSQSDVTSVSHV